MLLRGHLDVYSAREKGGVALLFADEQGFYESRNSNGYAADSTAGTKGYGQF